jgi:tRNA threonylcarbamoyladenosine biosynthesis protein TsaB
MKVLGIDTSTTLGGIALIDEQILIAETRLNVKVAHSERLMSEVSLCVERTGLSLDDIDLFAIAVGPGSFTGLRVGVSTVKGLAYATGKPVTAVSTLEAFAWNAAFSRYPVCPLLDARKKEVYGAVFQWTDEGFVMQIPEGAYPIRALVERLTEQTLFLGEGALLYRSDIEEVFGSHAIFGSPEMMAPSPAHVAQLGMRNARNNIFCDPATLTPRYYRRSEVETKNLK